jgi:hypothetical protein
MNDFLQAVNYVAAAFDLITKNFSTSARQISELNHLWHHNGVRGHGRGRYSGRNARGRGCGRGRQRSGGRNSNNNNNDTGSRSYSQQEWKNFTSAQRQEIYRQRERLATARTVASVLTEALTPNQGDDVSAITTKTGNIGNNQNNQGTTHTNDNNSHNQGRTTAQLSLDNISQALNRRRTTGAYTTVCRGTPPTRVISSISQTQERIG